MNRKAMILVVEDEPNICNFIATTLSANEYKVIECSTGKEAVSLIPSHCPDVVLLDLGLPDMDGLTVLKEVREWSDTPVIIVSARGDEKSKVQALDLGADDYITKPFGTSELLARIRTAIRHNTKTGSGGKSSQDAFKAKGLIIDFNKYLVTVNGEEVHLTQIEYKLVSLLARNAGKVLTYDFIISKIWGPFALKDNQILRVNMANIRRKLEKNPVDPEYIFTEIGVGYRMIEDD
ncbi:response regulator transcription factor [Anaerocolumna sp. MB42-C2]|uniref:response regulator transcription factor n=1 Tax=Anaerocolumna sp. MB42-C2 TaxID=3070997 RepID=UPI0027E1B668|nr:response regulator transcription factor [Anaerocolumna sp. MB42-C2]WMJ90075.1 response regulator transcription factor [Anaerocolumna sp. MB42-C2]